MKSSIFLQALANQATPRRPVWMMRQAGRYLPEYLELRKQQPDFLAFCKNVDWVTEVTLQPLKRFPLDAAILFSDILVLPKAMGVDLTIAPGLGPVVNTPIETLSQVKALSGDASEGTKHVMQAIKQIKASLPSHVPLIGFAGSPWTVATYCVGQGSKNKFHKIKKMLYAQPAVLHALLASLTNATIIYLKQQIDAGVDVIQIFDSWGGILTTSAYQTFSLHYMQLIVDALKSYTAQQDKHIPIILFTKGGSQWLSLMAQTNVEALSIDWTINLATARKIVPAHIALQGNLDPSVLLSNPEMVAEQTQAVLASYGRGPGHIFNLGHGIDKSTPIECVHAMLETVHAFKLNQED